MKLNIFLEKDEELVKILKESGYTIVREPGKPPHVITTQDIEDTEDIELPTYKGTYEDLLKVEHH